MQVISSKDNELIKHIKKLKDKKYRDESNEYIIEGVKLLEEAVKENAKITYKTNMSKKTALESLVVYVLKFILTEGITFGIMAIMNNCFSKEDLFYKIVDILLPLILTCITLILQFLAFNVIFKTKNDKNENEASSN